MDTGTKFGEFVVCIIYTQSQCTIHTLSDFERDMALVCQNIMYVPIVFFK